MSGLFRLRFGFVISVIALCLLGPPPAARAGQPCYLSGAEASSGDACWTSSGGTPQATRFSTLTDVTPANAGQLTQEFSVPTGVANSHEGAPLIVGTTMYVVTPFPNNLLAIDLANAGKVLWTYSPGPSSSARGVACCDVVNRGAAYANGLIVYAALDGTVVAVNASTGKLVWRTRIANPRNGETTTGAPIIVNGRVILGNAGGELGVRGWVQALSLTTGKQLWKAYSTGPDSEVLIDGRFKPFYAKERGANLGVTSWPAAASFPNTASWQQGGATVWGWISYDPVTDLIFYGTANPGVWNPVMRPGDNKWASTILARSPVDGHAVWAYQVTPHDAWDYDAINEDIVADLPIGGVTRQVVVHFNKNGFAYTLDRTTGEVLVAENFGSSAASVTWASSIDKVTGLPKLNPATNPSEGVVTPNICPSPLGLKNWEPAAFSPATKLFYVPTLNFCDALEPLKAFYIAGSPFFGASTTFGPGPNGTGPGGFLGEMVAWDASKGVRAWSVKEPLPLYGGALATAGGLVFYGTLDRHFKAVNANTGAVVFDKVLECGITSSPVSFAGPDGKQRIAITTGIGWLAGGLAGGACPRRGENSGRAPTTAATTGVVHVYKLP